MDGAANTSEEEAETMAMSARLEAEDALAGDDTLEFQEMWAICGQIVNDTVGPPETSGNDQGDEFKTGMRAAVRQLRVVEKWAAQVPPEQLVASVRAASALCHGRFTSFRTVARKTTGEWWPLLLPSLVSFWRLLVRCS
jgi:hypothetical protein